MENSSRQYKFSVSRLSILLAALLCFTCCQKQSAPSIPWKLKPFPELGNIVYRDIVPDTTIQTIKTALSRGAFYLDLNNDGTPDYEIFTYSIRYTSGRGNTRGEYFSYAKVACLGSNNAGETVSYPSANEYPISMGQPINNYGISWSDSTSTQTFLGTFNQPAGSDIYLALRITVGQYLYYGWVRMDVIFSSQGCSVTIKDYAYNSVPYMSILAGQTK